MPVEVIMPKVDMDMTHGTLAVWHVAEGDAVKQGAPLFDIETDKAAMEVEAPATGRLYQIGAGKGDLVAVGTVIAWIYAEGEVPGAAVAPPSGVSPAATTPTHAPPPVVAALAQKVRATPLARRIAAEHGLDLGAVTGTGPNGRIQKDDVEAARQSPVSAPPPALAATPPGTTLGPYANRPHTALALDSMRRTIAARLTEAKATIPHFYLRGEVRVDELLALRDRMNSAHANRDIKLSLTDYIVKAVALSLIAVPEANAVWGGDHILRMGVADIALAVAIDGGLITPVIRDAEAKGLAVLSAEIKDLAARARTRKLAKAEYQGGSFTISNLGMYGVDSFDAIINPPQAAILAVGSTLVRPVFAADGALVPERYLKLTLSVDHRVIDGALAARLLQAITMHLENPYSLLA